LLIQRSLIRSFIDFAPLQNEAQAIVNGGARAQKARSTAMVKLLNHGRQAIQHFEAGRDGRIEAHNNKDYYT